MSSSVTEGTTYGAWLVTQAGPKVSFCVCTICKQTTKYIKNYNLTSGRSKMCKACSTRSKKATHGMSDSPEYNTWVHINQRCHNPKNKDYDNYGGRGIEVCDLWRSSFEAFYLYIGPRPFPEATIERIDHNKGYEPGNVKWLSREQQVYNKRDNVYIDIDGVSKTVSQWAADSPVSEFTLYKRVSRGWPEKYGNHATIFTPSRGNPEEYQSS